MAPVFLVPEGLTGVLNTASFTRCRFPEDGTR